MDLWSKGLGRLVLQLRLSERSRMDTEESSLVMRGTMGKPTFWDWSVHLDAEDVVDFLVFLKRPDVVRYMIESDQRWVMLRTALLGAALFGARALRVAVFGDRARPPAPAPDALEAHAPAAGDDVGAIVTSVREERT